MIYFIFCRAKYRYTSWNLSNSGTCSRYTRDFAGVDQKKVFSIIHNKCFTANIKRFMELLIITASCQSYHLLNENK